MNNTEYALLEKLVLHNSDLKLLESKLANFNIFEAVGMTRQEIRHSYFLAFLLNPSESHYFGDLFLKQFLIKALQNLDAPSISAIAIDVANLEDVEVKREYKQIDILVYSQSEKIVVAIENKIDSGEHDDQLNRYRGIISAEFSDYQKFLIYLTKEGEKPEEDKKSEEDEKPSSLKWYVASYELISQCIDELCDQHATQKTNNFNGSMSDVIGSDNATISNNSFTQTNNATTAELLTLLTSMRQTVPNFPEDIREEITIDLDDLEAELQKPEDQRNPKRLKRSLIALFTAATMIATPIAGITDFTNNAIDIATKLHIELPQLPGK